MKLTIYQIEQNYNQLAEQLIDNDGELTTELAEQLAITEEQLQNKSVAYSFVIKQMDADIDTIDAEIKRLQAAKKQREKATEYLIINHNKILIKKLNHKHKRLEIHNPHTPNLHILCLLFSLLLI
jgi:hypothetical protein